MVDFRCEFPSFFWGVSENDQEFRWDFSIHWGVFFQTLLPREGLSLATEQELSACLWVLEAALGGEVSMPWCVDLRVVFLVETWKQKSERRWASNYHGKVRGGGFFYEYFRRCALFFCLVRGDMF